MFAALGEEDEADAGTVDDAFGGVACETDFHEDTLLMIGFYG